MRIRDLGALVVAVDADEHPVVGSRGAAMLSLLTIQVNQRVSVDALMDAAWGEGVTDGSPSTLESHIWRLRQLLEPGRARRQPATVLISDAAGYRLVAGSSSVDSLSFGACLSEVRDLLAGGRADAALRRADTALALWRGRPYGLFADRDWAAPAIARLEEVRSHLQERRIEALVATGALDLALADLQPLIAGLPFREQLRGLQMEALYRNGRTEQALQAYAQARRTLRDEVGIDPGVDLQRLHRRILDNDPALRGPGPDRTITVRSRGKEVHLPPTLTPLIGREQELDQLTSLVTEQHLITVTGVAGSGKTRVAIGVARAVADQFVDGVWFVDLTAVSDPALVVDVIISTIGFAASAGATPIEDLRNYLQTRRLLLVLDNCEHVLPGVERVVRLGLGDSPTASECCFLATSREPLGVDAETIWTLVPLGLPGPDVDPAASPAVELFLQRLSSAAPTLLVDANAIIRVAEICTALDGLPLPMELAAARARSYTLGDIAAQVADDPGRLGRIGQGPDDHRRTVRSAIEWSHRLLSPEEQRAHRRMAVLPGAFTAGLAGAVIDEAEDVDVDDLLAQLVHRSMLSSDGAREPGRPTVFRQLATVRSHARHVLAAAKEAAPATDRRDAWVGALFAARPPLGQVAEAEWYRRIDDDYPTVRAVLARHLRERPSSLGGRLAPRLTYYWYYREGLVEGVRWLQLAVDVLRDEDPVDQVVARIALAAALATQGRADLAYPHIDSILAQQDLEQLPADRLVEVGEALVGLVTAAWVPEAVAALVALHELLVRIAARAGSANLSLLADAVGCTAAFAAGRVHDAVRQAIEVGQRAVEADNLMAIWVSAGSPMTAALLAGNPVDGITWADRLLSAHLRLGTGAGGSFLETRANFAAQSGDYLEAARMYGTAYTETRRAAMVWPRRDLTEQLLTMTRSYLSRADFERAWQDGERLSVRDHLV